MAVLCGRIIIQWCINEVSEDNGAGLAESWSSSAATWRGRRTLVDGCVLFLAFLHALAPVNTCIMWLRNDTGEHAGAEGGSGPGGFLTRGERALFLSQVHSAMLLAKCVLTSAWRLHAGHGGPCPGPCSSQPDRGLLARGCRGAQVLQGKIESWRRPKLFLLWKCSIFFLVIGDTLLAWGPPGLLGFGADPHGAFLGVGRCAELCWVRGSDGAGIGGLAWPSLAWPGLTELARPPDPHTAVVRGAVGTGHCCQPWADVLQGCHTVLVLSLSAVTLCMGLHHLSPSSDVLQHPLWQHLLYCVCVQRLYFLPRSVLQKVVMLCVCCHVWLGWIWNSETWVNNWHWLGKVE